MMITSTSATATAVRLELVNVEKRTASDTTHTIPTKTNAYEAAASPSACHTPTICPVNRVSP